MSSKIARNVLLQCSFWDIHTVPYNPKLMGNFVQVSAKTVGGFIYILELDTLLLNEGIPRALKGKKLRLKNILLFPLIFEEINYF